MTTNGEQIPASEHRSGFLVKMRDGTKYLIPLSHFIQAEIADTLNVWNKEMERTKKYPPATLDQARKWAEEKFTNPMHPADIEDLFAGTSWGAFSDVAIQLPSESLSADELWDDTAEISLITS
jgi:hypothetical protein